MRAKPNATYRYLYDPQKDIKQYDRYCLKKQHGKLPKFSDCTSFKAVFYMKTPKNKPQLAGTYHKIKPDIDNLIKYVLDVCNFILSDDCIVCEIHAFKIYDPNPRTEFSFKTLSSNAIIKNILLDE